MSSAIERERTRLLDRHKDRHAMRLLVSGPSNGRTQLRQKGKMGAGCDILRRKKNAAVQSGTRGRGIQLKSA